MTFNILVTAMGDSLIGLEAIADTLVAISDAAAEPVLVKRLVLEALFQVEASKLILCLEPSDLAL